MLAEGKKINSNKNIFSTKIIAEIVVFVSLATVLSYIKIFTLPQGGSVTFASMVPILWLALRRGLKIGLFTATLYGVVQFALGAYFIHPVQIILDYPLAFGLLGIAGYFQNHPLLGVSFGVLGRFFTHFISGIIFFAIYTPEGMHPVIYSATYNGSFLIIELIISIYIIFMLLKSKVLRIYM
ncbi:energy-coupled thiamine transporter ThiT [Candidatus Bathyarchaeota archaeon]|nr:energy-coupled thiamine transporter ThiT [Candidatus Bathyarchaeota archaeon]